MDQGCIHILWGFKSPFRSMGLIQESGKGKGRGVASLSVSEGSNGRQVGGVLGEAK